MNKQFAIRGMSCQACATRLEKVLSRKVDHASVNFATETLELEHHQEISDEQIYAWVKNAGFEAAPVQAATPQSVSHVSLRLALLWLITGFFIVLMATMLVTPKIVRDTLFLQFILATIAQLFLAIPFYRQAYASIKGRLANMDVLISTGTTVIWLYSSIIYWTGYAPHTYFETSVMVLGFVSLGKFIEERVKKQSLNSIALLLSLSPKNVQVKRADQWQTIPLNQVVLGDLVRTAQGERIAVDGTVTEGQAWCDESHLTGESIPLEKHPQSTVLAGALVTNGSICYTAQRLGQDTLLGDMIAAMNEAQGSKAQIARLADRVAAVFVPTVLGIALLTFVLTLLFGHQTQDAVINAVAVLVIACPCALGLATPASIMVGIGLASRHGIWFKNASTLEKTAHLQAIAFDKTGTLTKGQFQVNHVEVLDSRYTQEQILQLCASIEQHVSHPIASSIVHSYQGTLLDITHIDVHTGQGVQAVYQNDHIRLGSPLYLQQDKQSPDCLIGVEINQQLVAWLYLGDELKPDTVQVVQALQHDGLALIILSGDQPARVTDIAAKLHITQAHGFMSPREKASFIAHQTVATAMVGDGVNDAAALMAASVSFSFRHGTDIAQHSADITLLNNSLWGVHQAIQIAQATVKNIKQNLFFALIYNMIGIPLAAFGLLNPSIAGLAMVCSSLSVLSNALRLKKYQVDQSPT